MTADKKPKVLGSDLILGVEGPYWENETRLYLDGDSFNRKFQTDRLNEFPLIEDFEVRLEERGNGTFGYHIYFSSQRLGYIASFSWWDHAEGDLIKDSFKIPIGDFEHAFVDADQGWNIVIAAQDHLVYVAQGDDDGGFYAWFKVEKDVYLAAWQKTIDVCRATFSEEDIHYHDFRPQKPVKPSLANEKVRLELVKRIAKVFANVPFPGKKEADIGNYWEEGKVVGKKWQQLTLNDINTDTGLKYFYPKAVQYYLPAYLKFLLLQPDQVYSMTRISLLYVLTPDSSDWKAKNLRVQVPFTRKQKEVIRIFFEGYAELFPFDNEQDELRNLLHRAIEYWQHVTQ